MIRKVGKCRLCSSGTGGIRRARAMSKVDWMDVTSRVQWGGFALFALFRYWNLRVKFDKEVLYEDCKFLLMTGEMSRKTREREEVSRTLEAGFRNYRFDLTVTHKWANRIQIRRRKYEWVWWLMAKQIYLTNSGKLKEYEIKYSLLRVIWWSPADMFWFFEPSRLQASCHDRWKRQIHRTGKMRNGF